MKNIKAITIAFLITLFGSSYALAEFVMGVSGSFAAIEASGTETEGTEKNSGEVKNNVGIGSIFVEMTDVMGSGISVGLDYIPMSADLSSATKTRGDVEKSVTGTAAETTTSRTQKAQAELDQHMTLYATYDMTPGLYFKLGYIQADLNTLESLGTGSKYGNETINGMIYGVGSRFDLGSNLEGRLELSYADYEDISIRSSVARTDVSVNNLIEADIDATLLTASLGYKF